MELDSASNGRPSRPPPPPPAPSIGRGAYLAWEDLTVVIPNFSGGPTRRLLDGLNGYAEPGRIMAIMGPSGSGKSTLLDSLAGRLARNVIMTGNLLLNGKKARLDYGLVAYVTQEDVLMGTLTVRETITYSAHLRLSSGLTKEEVNGIVEGTIIELGLQDCADRVIGSWQSRGVSGGERKRVSIALEILTRPQILFLDEPTSGLDSASAFFVIQALRNIARDGGRTVVSSIHQPSSEVFALFDDLFLLSSGETVYFGESKFAVEFFAEAGFPCPKKRNPSDHFLRCINSDFDTVTATLKGSQRIRETPATSDPLMNLATSEIKARLVENYRRSVYAKSAKSRIRELASIEGHHEMEVRKGSEASWFKQLRTLTKRSFVNMCRDIGYYWSRIVIYIVVSICVGTIFYDVGHSYTSILARVSCGGFITGFMTFMSIGGFPSFIEEMKVFYKERLSGYYGVSVYIISNYVSSFPTLTPSVRTLLSSIFTPKQKPPSLPLPLYYSSRSSSPHAASRLFSNAVALSSSPIHGVRSFGTLFTVRAFSSSTAASLQPQQNQNQNQPEEGSEKVPTLEVADGNHGGLEEETKLSLPVRAYFFSTSVDLKGLVEQNKHNFIPPTSRMTNYVVLKFGNHTDPTGTGGCISGSECIYMVVFQYGSIVLFNVREHEVDEYLKVVERHSSGLLSEMRKDEYEVRENPDLNTWMQGGLDYIMLQFLNIDGIRTIGSVLGQSIALDYYGRQVDGMVAEFTDINRGMEKTGTFTMDRKKLFQLVGKANSNLADVILKLGLFERSDIAWKDAKYAQIWEYLRDEFELTQRFASLDFKLKFVEHNIRFLQEILQNRKSDFLEWLIIILISAEIAISLYDMVRRSL